MDDKPKRAASWISLIYALVGAIWILASDQDGVNFLSKPFQAAKLAQTVRNNLDC